jgi:hypothetical protein
MANLIGEPGGSSIVNTAAPVYDYSQFSNIPQGPPTGLPPTTVLANPGTTAANPEKKTTYFKDVQAWRDAGSPAGNDTLTVIIGEPPKAGQPATGAKNANGDVIAWSNYDPKKSPTYVPPEPKAATPSNISAGGTGSALTPTIGAGAADIKTRVASFEQDKTAYQQQASAFGSKWSSLTQTGAFTGSDSQYKEYQNDYRQLEGKRIDLDMQSNEINARAKELEREQDKELANYVKVGDAYVRKEDWANVPEHYQKIAEAYGLDKMNEVVQLDNKAEIKAALVSRFEGYKKEDGSYDLAQAVKDGLGEKTIATAFGAEVAHTAVVTAGPPPIGGWGKKAPTLPYAVGVVTAETLFPPAKQWVEPELHYKATGMDWAIGVGQLALMVVDPALGALGKAGLAGARGAELVAEGSRAAASITRAEQLATAAQGAGFALKAGATVVFSKDTIANWNELKKNPWALGLSIGMDALIAASAIRAMPKFANTKDAQIERLVDRVSMQAKKAEGYLKKYDPKTQAMNIERVKAGPAEEGFGTGGTMSKAQYEERVAKAAEEHAKPKPWELTPEQRAMSEKGVPADYGELKDTFKTLSDGIKTGDTEAIRKAGREALDWTRRNPDTQVSDVLDRRARHFLEHADEYVQLDVNKKIPYGKPEAGPKMGSEDLKAGLQDRPATASNTYFQEMEIKKRMELALERKADAFYRDHKLPSWVSEKKVGESPADHAQRVRDHLDELYGRDYVDERMNLTDAERADIIKEVMGDAADDAIGNTEGMFNEIDDFLKGERGKDKPTTESTKPVEPAPEPERGGGGGTAVKEKTEVKTKSKAEVEAEKILEEKTKTETTAKERVREDIKAKADAAAKVKADAEAKAKAKVDEAARIKEEVAAKGKSESSPAVQPSTQSKTQPATRTSTTLKTAPKVESKTRADATPAIQPSVRADAAVKPAEQTRTKPAEETKGATKTTPTTTTRATPVPEVKPITNPEINPFEPVDIRLRTEVKKKVLPPSDNKRRQEWTPDDIRGSQAIKAGMGWWLRAQDGRLKFFLKLPEGVKAVGGGKGSGYRSVQTVQGKPMDADIKIGFVTAKIRTPSREPGKAGAVTYQTDTTAHRPGMTAERNGQVLNIKGVGLKRGRLPRGRILKAGG